MLKPFYFFIRDGGDQLAIFGLADQRGNNIQDGRTHERTFFEVNSLEVIMGCPLNLFEVLGRLAMELNFFDRFEIFSPLCLLMEEAGVLISSF